MSGRGHVIFGDANAERDDLLADCSVLRHVEAESRSIVVGRWGSGKTATMLIQQADLEAELAAIYPANERIWYINESRLEIDRLLELQSVMERDSEHFSRLVERLWRIEILRILALQLATLRNSWSETSFPRWDSVENLRDEARRTVWHSLPEITRSWARGGSVHERSITPTPLVRFGTEEVRDIIFRCLMDIKPDEILPAVVIEPIETPSRNLDDHPSLAKTLLTALLNVFEGEFVPTSGNNLNVRLSIPWHRFDRTDLDFPQKITDYIGILTWSVEDLRGFINKRISYEFARVGRKSPKGGRDPWATLFEDQVSNPYCDPVVKEESFRFILRYSHYRPRDVLRLTQAAVARHSRALGVGPDEILRGRRGRVPAEVLLRAAREASPLLVEDLKNEGRRIVRGFDDLVGILRGLEMPFTTQALGERIKRHAETLRKHQIPCEFTKVFDLLWDSGVIGIAVEEDSPEVGREFEARYDPEARRQYGLGKGQVRRVWTWFEHTIIGQDGSALLEELQHMEVSDIHILVHPRLFRDVTPKKFTKRFPIGI